MVALDAVTTIGDTAALFQGIGVARATLYGVDSSSASTPTPPRALGARWGRPNAKRGFESSRGLEHNGRARRQRADYP